MRLCFVNGSSPGLLDAAVFAHVWTVLEYLGESQLEGIINVYQNLIRHSSRVHKLVYE